MVGAEHCVYGWNLCWMVSKWFSQWLYLNFMHYAHISINWNSLHKNMSCPDNWIVVLPCIFWYEWCVSALKSLRILLPFKHCSPTNGTKTTISASMYMRCYSCSVYLEKTIGSDIAHYRYLSKQQMSVCVNWASMLKVNETRPVPTHFLPEGYTLITR